jgi:hypothetical protein
MNHYPIGVNRRQWRIPGLCAHQTGTANPFAPITCPDCRERFTIKVAAHREIAAQYREGSPTNRFFTADANRNQRILDGGGE